MNKEEIIEKLKPFWKKRQELQIRFRKQEEKIEKEMSKALKKKIEFFYVDGECCGIGAQTFEDRKKFPLIHDSELY